MIKGEKLDVRNVLGVVLPTAAAKAAHTNKSYEEKYQKEGKTSYA